MKKFRQLVRENEDFESEAARTYKEKPNKEPMKKLKEEHPDVKFQKDMAAKERAKLQHMKATQQRKEYERQRNEMEKQRLAQRLNKEEVKDKFDIGEYDQEGDMAKSDLRSIISNAKRVHDMLEDSDNLPEWVQSKITKAEDYMSTVANYMEAEMNEEVEIEESMPASKSLQKRHEDERKKRGLPDPSYYLKLRDQKKKEIEDMKKEEVDESVASTIGGLVGQYAGSKLGMEGPGRAHGELMGRMIDYHARKLYKKAKKVITGEEVEQIDEKNVPTSPEKWAQAKAQAKAKFDVYPSAYANGWASKKYKEMGGGWKSVSEETDLEEGYYKSKEIEKQETERLKPPFTPDKPKNQAIAGKQGAGYSTARHLARQAMKKYVKEEDTEKFYTSSRKSQIVKNAAKNKNENKFEPDPVLSKMADKKD